MVAIIFLLVTIIGCTNGQLTAETLPEPTAMIDLTVAIVPTATPPEVEPTMKRPLNPTNRPVGTRTPLPTIVPTTTPFIPPAANAPSIYEHYWLERPIASNGIPWTDKVYPYGSTLNGRLQVHHGVEFAASRNTTILSAQAGTVVVAGDDLEKIYGTRLDFYGKLVIIQHDLLHHGQPVYTLYAHLSDVLVSPGWRVDAQQVIARSGASGIALGPHLHFEVRVGQNSYDHTRNPLLWLRPFEERGTIAGRVTLNGSYIPELKVTANRIDGAGSYHSSKTYADGRINSDEGWQENFVFDDVWEGRYQLKIVYNDETYTAETEVYTQQTTFVAFELEE